MIISATTFQEERKQENRNCPQCSHWWFNRTQRGCNKGHKLTNTTYMLGSDRAIGPCEDFHDKNI